MAQAIRSLSHPKAYFEEGSEAMIALEAMVDHATIRNVAYALAHICWDKADHVRSNWQDEALAKDWERNARAIDKLASRLDSIP
jgi:hypothetical protein